MTHAGIPAAVSALAVRECKDEQVRHDHDFEIIFPWRHLFEILVTPTVMQHIGAAGVNSPLWYALARNLGRVLTVKNPPDTKALLLRDARNTWLSRGVTPAQWTIFESVARELMALD
jgi:hypothetical protein